MVGTVKLLVGEGVAEQYVKTQVIHLLTTHEPSLRSITVQIDKSTSDVPAAVDEFI